MKDYRTLIKNQIVNFDFLESCIFGLVIFRRLYPNFQEFNRRYHFCDVSELLSVHSALERVVRNGNFARFDSSKMKNVILDLMPEPGDYEDILASSALDASSVLYELNEFLADNNLKRIKSISELAFDSVDMYIQEKYDLGIHFDESIITKNPLMIREFEFQLALISTIKEKNIETLDQFIDLKGSLELN